MSNNTTTFGGECPDEILNLLPWFSEGDLEDEEQGMVEAHLASCRSCRAELKMLDGEAIEIPAGLPSAERVYGRVKERIAARGERTAKRVSAAPPPRRSRPGFATSGAANGRWLALAASVLGAVLVGQVWLARERAAEATYQPAAMAATASGAAIDVIFRDDVPLKRINAALRAIDGTVVAGPGDLGRYRVELPAGRNIDVSAAARVLRLGSSSGEAQAPAETGLPATSEADWSFAGLGVAVFAEPIPE